MDNIKNTIAIQIASLYSKYIDVESTEFDILEFSNKILFDSFFRMILINELYADIKHFTIRNYIKKSDSTKINDALEILSLLNNFF